VLHGGNSEGRGGQAAVPTLSKSSSFALSQVRCRTVRCCRCARLLHSHSLVGGPSAWTWWLHKAKQTHSHGYKGGRGESASASAAVDAGMAGSTERAGVSAALSGHV